MAAHLWTDAPAPMEYIRLYLCRDVYHCTPEEVERIPFNYILEDLAMISIENKVNKMRNNR